MDLWSACSEKIQPVSLTGTVLRLVESQEQVATNSLVSTLAAQKILEDLLEHTKPSLEVKAHGYHFLLFTPFRYPPLQHGSRFSASTEPSLFYGSKNVTTVLAEAAYYRFYFWLGMETAPSEKILSQHTLFAAHYSTSKALQLQHSPFDQYLDYLTDKTFYQDTQYLGLNMRENQIEAFEYVSARDNKKGINVALFYLHTLKSKRPEYSYPVLCETNEEQVQFYRRENEELYTFNKEQFCVNDMFPFPAS